MKTPTVASSSVSSGQLQEAEPGCTEQQVLQSCCAVPWDLPQHPVLVQSPDATAACCDRYENLRDLTFALQLLGRHKNT